MSDMATERSRADSEAARWFARLNRPAVTTGALREFRDWRSDPLNAEAYARVDATWRQAGGLAGDSDLQAATAEALAKRPSRARSPRRLPAPLLIGGGLVACAGLLAALLLGLGQPTYRTGVGEQRLVVLRDGSRLRLNTDSEVKVRFGPAERRIVLAKGEAFFEAAHDAAHPFVVEADGARVRALGTKFDVRRDPASVQVTLLEGRVQVARPDQRAQATLIPNQQLTVSGRGITRPVAADAGEVAGWTTGRLSFRGVALADAVAEVNRYAVHKIALDTPAALGRQPVSGVFNAGDTPAFVAAVSAFFDLQATTAPDGSIHLAPKA
jgi:transmembrane sensor